MIEPEIKLVFVCLLVLMVLAELSNGHAVLPAFVLGLVLWLGYRFSPEVPTMVGQGTAWLHAKLALVVLILIHFVIAGRWLKGVAKGRALPSPFTLRLFNELPLIALIVIVWLVLAKPF